MIALLSLLACGPKPAPAPEAPEPVIEVAAPHRLAVILVVDQLPVELFERMRPHYTGGFARLAGEQSWVGTSRYHHSVALTCPGHATLATGASPKTHGIIGNAWVEEGEVLYCGDIANLRSEGLADSVKRSGGTVAAFSLKDRAALMLGGRTPDAQAWYLKKQGTWSEGAPEWLPTEPIQAALTQGWEARRPELYATLQEDDNPWEEIHEPLGGTTFPHTAPGVDNPALFRMLPASGTLLTDIAIESLDRLALGSDDVGDLLAVSYSQTDYIGHAFTAQSWEAMDGLLALDADLGRLLDALDAKVGAEHYAVFLTADHGAAPGTAKRVDPEGLEEAIQQAVTDAGLEGEALIGETTVYLPDGPEEARAAAARAVAALFDDREGFAGAWAWRVDGLPEDTPHREAIAASLHPERAGDVTMLLEEGVLLAYEGSVRGTSHGTPYDYDTRVPLLVHGATLGTAPGSEVDARSIAPTLAAWLGVEAPADAEVEALPLSP